MVVTMRKTPEEDKEDDDWLAVKEEDDSTGNLELLLEPELNNIDRSRGCCSAGRAAALELGCDEDDPWAPWDRMGEGGVGSL